MSNPWRQLAQLADSKNEVELLADQQLEWLLECLQRNKKAEYGQRYEFSSIETIEDFQQRVPLVDYEAIIPWIDRVARGEENVIFAGRAVAFENTGGSTGGHKHIPYSVESFADFRRALLPWLAGHIDRLDIAQGSAYFSISPACREPAILPSGIPIGLPDGAYLGDDIVGLLDSISAVPSWIGTLDKVSDWQIATLYHLIVRKDLVLVSIWSPTFFSQLLDAIEAHAESLEYLFKNGGDMAGYPLSPDEGAHLRLAKYLDTKDVGVLWPELKLVSCWSDASSRPFFEELKERIPRAVFEGKGLLSTEGVVTVPDKYGKPCLASKSGFFEFIDSAGDIYPAQGLVAGRRYEVIVTTSGGLYRYRTGDLVLCESSSDSSPVLRFDGRCGLLSDMVGEKLTENFVNGCLQGIDGFRMLVPVSAPKPRYVLIVDKARHQDSCRIREEVEKLLLFNPQYEYARKMSQLDDLEIIPLSEPANVFTELALARGSRLGDIKILALSDETIWTSYIEAQI